MKPGLDMLSVEYFRTHNATIQKQLEQLKGYVPGQLVAGRKKDVVVGARAASKPGKVCIYGWHETDGHPIQPLSTKHEAT